MEQDFVVQELTEQEEKQLNRNVKLQVETMLVDAYTQYNNYCVDKNRKPISFRRWKNINAKPCSHCGLMLWQCGCGGHCFPELTGKEEAD